MIHDLFNVGLITIHLLDIHISVYDVGINCHLYKFVFWSISFLAFPEISEVLFSFPGLL